MLESFFSLIRDIRTKLRVPEGLEGKLNDVEIGDLIRLVYGENDSVVVGYVHSMTVKKVRLSQYDPLGKRNPTYLDNLNPGILRYPLKYFSNYEILEKRQSKLAQ